MFIQGWKEVVEFGCKEKGKLKVDSETQCTGLLRVDEERVQHCFCEGELCFLPEHGLDLLSGKLHISTQPRNFRDGLTLWLSV